MRTLTPARSSPCTRSHARMHTARSHRHARPDVDHHSPAHTLTRIRLRLCSRALSMHALIHTNSTPLPISASSACCGAKTPSTCCPVVTKPTSACGKRTPQRSWARYALRETAAVRSLEYLHCFALCTSVLSRTLWRRCIDTEHRYDRVHANLALASQLWPQVRAYLSSICLADFGCTF